VATTALDVEARLELARQVETLVGKGYPRRAGLTEEAFRELIAPLEERLAELPAPSAPERVPFVLVAPIPRQEAVPLLDLRGKPGYTDMAADDLVRFVPTEHVAVPADAAYLLVDVDTGCASLNVTPDDALSAILAEGRSPLTIDEGIALVMHRPDLLRKNACFSLLGSRCGDRRVPALWIKSSGQPRLGWCWAGNPHTWLGSASCGGRLGA
jgi:hypothetical protein